MELCSNSHKVYSDVRPVAIRLRDEIQLARDKRELCFKCENLQLVDVCPAFFIL